MEIPKIYFTGTRCCVFDNPKKAKSKLQGMTIVKRYGDTAYNPDGTVKHYLYTWDEGKRWLIQCPACKAYFLVQSSEFHGGDDSYYCDWFQVEDESKAEFLNSELDGFKIEQFYIAPTFFETNGNFYV